jgi:hypothetical protein
LFFGSQSTSTYNFQQANGLTQNLIVGQMYFGTYFTPVKVVMSTQLTQVFVESATLCTTCNGATLYNYTTNQSAGTFVFTTSGVTTNTATVLTSPSF